jgi:hypothetical protein
MTKIQLEMLTAYYGMMQEGYSKEEAMGYIACMGYGFKNMLWLVQKLQKRA